MRTLAALALAAGVCLASGEAAENILVLKNGQRIVYDNLSQEGSTLFVRTGGQSLMIDAADVAPTPEPEPESDGKFGIRAARTGVPMPVARLIAPNAGKHNLRPELIQAVMEVESGYKVQARSRVGAIGLMQLMPGTARHLNVNAYDPAQNVAGGAKYLDMLISRYEHRKNGLVLAIAAYNAGPGAVDRYNGVPPFAETRRYVTKVMKRYKQLVSEKKP